MLVRSVWDYPSRRDDFLAWTRSCERIANPHSVLRWNTDKRYLQDLAARGVTTVPTTFVAPGDHFCVPDGDFVVKPTVSSSAADTGRFRSAGREPSSDLVARIHAQGRTAMVQPYLRGIEEDGETSLVYLGGRYSHAVRREPLLTTNGEREPVVVADGLGTVQPAQPSADQFDLEERTLAAVPGGRRCLSYARIDLLPGACRAGSARAGSDRLPSFLVVRRSRGDRPPGRARCHWMTRPRPAPWTSPVRVDISDRRSIMTLMSVMCSRPAAESR